MSLIIIVLILLWFLGYITIPGIAVPQFPLFQFNGKPVTLWDIVIFLVILWAIESAPSPIRKICIVLVIVWTLSTLHIIAITGLSTILVVAVIGGLVLSLFK